MRLAVLGEHVIRDKNPFSTAFQKQAVTNLKE